MRSIWGFYVCVQPRHFALVGDYARQAGLGVHGLRATTATNALERSVVRRETRTTTDPRLGRGGEAPAAHPGDEPVQVLERAHCHF
ncbi:hypothetical protein SAMN04244571_04803 [Azotobacter beijerinckii]|uniref:Uncharacterized protein n=1 Tax=Azotobacter beijerinckii TaxID=170623 RepID=A0A1I1CS29_9GAMM|nr:hypothetical protein SAMN04244571_04803 [Azotobacter beijerinckii]